MVWKAVRIGLMVCWLSQAAQAATTERNIWNEAGYGTLAMVTNLGYMPVKLVYGLIGTLTGGLAYLVTVGNVDVAKSIWNPSVGGTYVVTPAMLRGDEPLLFNGASYSKE
jgi:hypothetical protein